MNWRGSNKTPVKTPAMVVMLLVGFCVLSSTALAETRSLKLYYLHTGEKATISYKKNGKYIDSGLKKINVFLRDWRRNEPTKMDPRLLDLVWEVYRDAGSRDYIHVISGYRSPATNKMLKKRGRGVASKSQHTLGKALDFFMPDVKLSKLRSIGLKKQLGGVGYYPSSGSPFIHIDTGRVRHWPRMSRKELVRVFPKGNTLHVPTDGKPLPGFNKAQAAYERKISSQGKIVVAKAEEPKKKPNFFKRLLGAKEEDEEEDLIANNTPAPTLVKTTSEPSSVPVPSTASNSNNNGASVEIAGLTTEISPASDNALGEVASFVIPVPEQRPDYTAPDTNTLIAENTGSDEASSETTEIALAVDPVVVPEPVVEPAPTIKVAALTPNEIEDLRREVYAALEETNPTDLKPNAPDLATVASTPEIAPDPDPNQELQIAALEPIEPGVGASGALALPEPNPQRALEDAAEVVVASLEPLEPGTSASGDLALPEPNPQRAVEEIPETVVASLEPIEPGTNASGDLALPEPNPQRAEEETVETVLARLEPIEPGTSSSGAIAFPEINPDRPTIEAEPVLVTALLPIEPGIRSGNGPAFPIPNPERLTIAETLPVEDEPEEFLVAGIPVPEINPRRTSQLEPEIVLAALPRENVALAARTISLEEFSMPDLNESMIGKWALATDATIAQIADIRLPAYGRNAIRELPSTVLTRGFARGDNNSRVPNRFTGSSVEFLAFSKFE